MKPMKVFQSIFSQVDCICDYLIQRKDVKTLERFIRFLSAATTSYRHESKNGESPQVSLNSALMVYMKF